MLCPNYVYPGKNVKFICKIQKDINNSPVKSPITQNMLIKQPIERCRTNQYTIDGISNKTKRKTIKDGMYNFLREKDYCKLL